LLQASLDATKMKNYTAPTTLEQRPGGILQKWEWMV